MKIEKYHPSEEYLWVIEDEIKTNFKISNPIFLFNFKKFDNKSEIFDWILAALEKGRVVRYNFLKDNIFELKDFSPDPSDEACERFIGQFLNDSDKFYGISDLFFQVVDCEDSKYYFGVINNKKEVNKELLFNLRQGRSRIGTYDGFFPDLKPSGKRKIVKVYFEEEELGRDLGNGYVTFENKY